MMRVLVTGATGNVGAGAVRALQRRRVPVRVFVRDPNRAAARLGNQVEVATGDFSDLDTVRRALREVSHLCLSSANGPQQVEHECRVIDAASATGIRRIVKISTVGAAVGSPVPGCDWHGRIEEHLRQSGVPAVIIRSNFFMTNLLTVARQVRGQGRLFAPADEGQVAMIDPRDVGGAAAAVLTGEDHDGRIHVLTGPEALTYAQVAAVLSATTGRSVEFVSIPEAAARQGLAQAGMPEWLVEQVVRVFELIRQGQLAKTTGAVRALTGRNPLRFAEWAQEHAGSF